MNKCTNVSHHSLCLLRHRAPFLTRVWLCEKLCRCEKFHSSTRHVPKPFQNRSTKLSCGSHGPLASHVLLSTESILKFQILELGIFCPSETFRLVRHHRLCNSQVTVALFLLLIRDDGQIRNPKHGHSRHEHDPKVRRHKREIDNVYKRPHLPGANHGG